VLNDFVKAVCFPLRTPSAPLKKIHGGCWLKEPLLLKTNEREMMSTDRQPNSETVSKTPVNALPAQDHGAQTLRNYRYQSAYAVVLLVGAISKRNDYNRSGASKRTTFFAKSTTLFSTPIKLRQRRHPRRYSIALSTKKHGPHPLSSNVEGCRGDPYCSAVVSLVEPLWDKVARKLVILILSKRIRALIVRILARVPDRPILSLLFRHFVWQPNEALLPDP
jgi:hypothetical protein